MRELSLILDAGDVCYHARAIRELPAEHLDRIRSPKVLRRAANLLRAGAYSATTAAVRLEARARQLDVERTPVERVGEAER